MKHTLYLFIAIILLAGCKDEKAEVSAELNAEQYDQEVAAESQQNTILASLPNGKISIEQARALHASGEVQFVDLRTPEEIASHGKIEGAVELNIRDADFKHQFQQLDGRTPIVFYCQAGGRSGRAYKMAEDMGFSRIFDMTDGYPSWKAEN